MIASENICWPGWETVQLIGRGSYGAVYEIHRQVFDSVEKAALKVISIPQNSSDIEEMYSDGYDDESLTELFQAHLKSIVSEYTLMRKMNGSANIVNCDDIRHVQHDDGIGWDIFIKMELLTPLNKALPNDIPEDTVIKIAKDICAALELCKKHNIVHRDIKPQNIFLSANGDYKLGDFGIAKTVEKTMGGTKIGTYKYMAPEVYNNQPYGGSADIYSLGLVLYWLLNEHRLPFLPMPPTKLKAGMEEEARYRRLSGEALPPPAHGSKKLQQIVLKACAYAPEDRYATATEMLKDLEGLHNALIIEEAFVSGDMCTGKIMQPKELNLEFANDVTIKINTEKSTPEPIQAEQHKNISRYIKIALIAMGVLAILILFLLLRSCEKNANDPSSGTSTALPVQQSWSEWADDVPDYVSSENYDIEEQTLYSSRTTEYTSSKTQTEMDGWELYDTVEAGDSFGLWSEWSEEGKNATMSREVESQLMYRYQDKETTTDSSSSKSGWTLYDTTYSWGDYGSWSNWSTSAVSASDTRKVETKKQYRYRNKSYTTEYSSWGAWSSWSTVPAYADDLTDVQSATVWGYYYFRCPYCGAHMHVSTACYSWAGGCGRSLGSGVSEWHQIRSTTSWEDAGLRDWHGTGKQFTHLNGELVFKWNTGDGYAQTGYRYRTRTEHTILQYSNWSNWGDTAYSNSSTREVESRTMYRYCDRSQVATYHYYRWNDWSDWSEVSFSESDDRRIEKKTLYRYRDQVTATTYYFRRWTDWTEYSASILVPSDNVEVRTKTQYRFKSKLP